MSKIETMLFIGGPADGERVHTDGKQYWTVLKRRPHIARAMQESEFAYLQELNEEHRYHRECFEAQEHATGEKTDFYFYRHERMSLTEASAALFGSYVAQK